MTLDRLEPCCLCADHQRPYRNEDGWIITGLPDRSDTWQAWTEAEWKRHCDRYLPARKVQSERDRKRYQRNKRKAA